MPQRHTFDKRTLSQPPRGRYLGPSPVSMRGGPQRKRKKKPSGVNGVPHYKADSRQLPPEEMPAFTPGIAVKTVADIPRFCTCIWVPHVRRVPECVTTAWELKFTYALCREAHAVLAS